MTTNDIRGKGVLRWSAIVLAGITVASAANCSGGQRDAPATPSVSEDQAAVMQLVLRQGDLVKDRNWGALYDTYARSQQETCARDAFIQRRNAAIPTATDLTSFTVDELQVRVDGDKAYATYVDRLNRTPVATATDAKPDLYIRVDGAWYDEFDPQSSC